MAVETVSFGCRLNAVESEIVRERIAQTRAGTETDTRDLVVVNTCAVTAQAGRDARKAIRRIARERPAAEIVVTGCGAEIETQAYAAMPQVARLVGNGVKLRPDPWRTEAASPRPRLDGIGRVMTERIAQPTAITGMTGHTRAFVPVQNGCDHRCTFCAIPFGRGPSRSVPVADVVAQVRRIVEHGGREVVLTGVDLTAYGRDLAEGDGLGRLVGAILRGVPDLARLRLSSLDSIEVEPDLVEAFATQARLMPHVHLSLQAGDDLILKRMRRRHTRVAAVALCETLRRARPDMVFGADIIAGFPTETEAQFCRSLDLVGECGLTHLHVFPFSPRPGTPAARMPPVADADIRSRAGRLREAGATALVRHLDTEKGRIRRVLTERGDLGRTEAFAQVRLPAETPAGRLIDVAIAGHDGRVLHATGVVQAVSA